MKPKLTQNMDHFLWGRPKPGAILGKLIEAINHRNDKPFVIEAEPIFDSTSFWEFAKSNDMILKKIKFEFVIPNMWGAKSSLDEDLKDTGDQTGGERVSVGISGSNGVFVDNQKVRDGVEYAERGAGIITASAMDSTPYSSKSVSKTTKTPEVKGDKSTMHNYFSNLKNKIFGREEDFEIEKVTTTINNDSSSNITDTD